MSLGANGSSSGTGARHAAADNRKESGQPRPGEDVKSREGGITGSAWRTIASTSPPAAALNTAIFVVEAVAGFEADSLSLLMDCVHNLSDEMALAFLYLAFILSHGISRHLLRSANVFNSVGLVLISALLLWQACERILHPAPVVGSIAVVVGLLAAAANWGVARLLLAPSRNNAAIRLAYIHNIGDVYVSFAPVAAGFLVGLTGYSMFDPLIAAAIAVWIIVSTTREVLGSSDELIWPEKIVCGHSDHEEAAVGASSSRS